MTFRSLTKEPVPGLAPTEIVDEIRLRAARDRRSYSSVVSEILCAGLGLDPSRYGIDPDKARRHRHTSNN